MAPEGRFILEEGMEREAIKSAHRDQWAKKRHQKRRMKARSRQVMKESMTLTCPNGPCQKKVMLVCPFCGNGSLECDSGQLLVSCNKCHQSLRHLPCYHCGFILKPSLILQKQTELRKVMTNADGGGLAAVGVWISVFAGVLWSIVQLAG